LIEIPNIDGTYWPSRAGEFIPIVNKLRNLHKNNYVYGDIRLFNMVFPMHYSQNACFLYFEFNAGWRDVSPGD
jgi:hypothetical protein